MKTVIFIIIVLASGAIAGLVHGVTNHMLVESYLDAFIGLENQNLFDSGIVQDTDSFQIEYEGYRAWQKSGQILASVILGVSFGALFGIVYSLSRNSLPGSHDVKKSIILAGIMWGAIFVIPFLKYPANPPTVGDPETLFLRTILYISFVVLSGVGAVIFYKVSKQLESKKILALAGYGILVITSYIIWPENPDTILAPLSLVDEFRLVSFLGPSIFWITLGVTLGVLWHRFETKSDSQFVE